MLKITLDTNCIINLLDYKSETATSVEDLAELFRYGMEGDVNIVITTRVEADMADKDGERNSELIKRVAMFPTIGTPFRIGTSRLDSGDYVIGDPDDKLEKELTQIIFPGLTDSDPRYQNKIYDIDHLVGHISNKRDIFVTDDKGILKKAEALKVSPGVVVMNPKTCLDYVNLKANKKVLIEQFYEKLKTYKDLLLQVQVDNDFAEKEQLFTGLREWLLKKYPVVKDGLLQFKLNMQSVPAGPGQMVFDQSNLLGLGDINQRIQKLFVEPDLKTQIDTILAPLYETEGLHYSNPKHRTPSGKLADRFQGILDLLLAYSGYLENNF